MLRNRKWLSLVCGAALAALASAPAISLSGGVTDAMTADVVLKVFPQNPEAGSPDPVVRNAATRFVRAMMAKDAGTVWMFASEEEHDAFPTEQATYEAYAETFPVLAQAKSVRFDRFWQEGDTPFVEITIADAEDNSYRATMGFWLDDAGDWKLISCEVEPVTDQVAGL